MQLTSHHFNATRPETISQGTIQDLIRWMAVFVAALFPDAVVQHWTDGRVTREVKPARLRELLDELQYRYTVAVYVTSAGNEAQHLNVALISGSGASTQHYLLAIAKIDSGAEMCWQIANALSHALELTFHWQEQPAIVDILHALPGGSELTQSGSLSCVRAPRTLTVVPRPGPTSGTARLAFVDSNGHEVASIGLGEADDGASYRAQALQMDAVTLGHRLGFEVKLQEREVLASTIEALKRPIRRQSAATQQAERSPA